MTRCTNARTPTSKQARTYTTDRTTHVGTQHVRWTGQTLSTCHHQWRSPIFCRVCWGCSVAQQHLTQLDVAGVHSLPPRKSKRVRDRQKDRSSYPLSNETRAEQSRAERRTGLTDINESHPTASSAPTFAFILSSIFACAKNTRNRKAYSVLALEEITSSKTRARRGALRTRVQRRAFPHAPWLCHRSARPLSTAWLLRRCCSVCYLALQCRPQILSAIAKQ